jgi:hypothetical protein
MKPGCKVTLVVDDKIPADEIAIQDKTTGSTQTFSQSYWERFFTMKGTKDGKLQLMPLRHTLYLAQGAYVFEVRRGDVVKKTEVVLDAATKLIRLE